MITPKVNWNSNDYYNFADLNRVESNIQFVADYLVSMGYAIPLEAIVTNRDMLSIDFVSSINRVERNLDSIRANLITPPTYQDMKVWSKGMGFNFDDANRYERNLLLLYKWADLIAQSFKYCGTFNCGEEVV